MKNFLLYPIKTILNFFNKIKIKNFFKTVTIEKIDAIDGFHFEELVSLIFKYYGYKVNVTKSSNDFGADLIIEKHGIKIAIQTKLYYGHGVGNSAVQQVKGALKYYKAHFGCVFTNWNFTKQAKNLAQIENVILIDRNNLKEFLVKIKNNENYETFNNLYKNLKVNVKGIG